MCFVRHRREQVARIAKFRSRLDRFRVKQQRAIEHAVAIDHNGADDDEQPLSSQRHNYNVVDQTLARLAKRATSPKCIGRLAMTPI